MPSEKYEELRRKIYNAVGDQTPYTEFIQRCAKTFNEKEYVIAIAIDYNVYHKYVDKFRLNNKFYLKKNAFISSNVPAFR